MTFFTGIQIILKPVLDHKAPLVAKGNLRGKKEAKDSLFNVSCWENWTATVQKNQILSYTIYKS